MMGSSNIIVLQLLNSGCFRPEGWVVQLLQPMCFVTAPVLLSLNWPLAADGISCIIVAVITRCT